jgi:hypothetical protein
MFSADTIVSVCLLLLLQVRAGAQLRGMGGL